MTPLEDIALVAAILSIIDAVSYMLAMPKKRFQKWTNFLTKILNSKSRWILPLFLMVLILVFGYFTIQQLTIIQIIPGIFIGALLGKFVLVAQYPKETTLMAKRLSEKVDWPTIILDLIIAGAVIWSLFLR